ncbi:uncharacterized protein LOC118185319, partial [Stegodyphus dumicola]|uniref:uncharacterized protein LOC118185319 n=1 Tax=Stegodyphus dumicola TaxID=202533 RepID=UPI0015AB8F4E
MDVTPSAKFISKPRSSRSRHGSLKGGSTRRPPSPDSACEHDGEWVGGAISGPEDVNSDMSEEGSEKTRKGARRKIESAVLRRQSGETTAVLKGAACQDSDVDSGIVAYRKPGQRIGSTSSADTDSSQESRRRIEYSPPIQKNDLPKSRSCNGSLRVAKRTSCPNQQGGPIKADHSALKECNRRPPTPLTVFPDSHHCVRFDEQLQLSEQNLRRSCRKLFATLYAQRFSYPVQQSGSIQARNITPGSTRIRSRTAPELDLRRYSPVSVGGQSRHIQSYKENFGPVENHRAGGLPWAVCSVPKATTDVSLSGQVLSSPPPSQVHRYNFHMYNRVPMDLDNKVASRTPSTDSGLGSSSQCTCHSRQTHISLSSSQSNTSQCTCRCCNCVQQVPRVLDGTAGLFKSSSCSTLSSVLSHQSRPQLTQFPPRTMRRPLSPGEPDSKLNLLQKTSSCSNLLDKVSGNYQIANVPVYSDSMVHAYAQIASVIPDGVKSCSSSQGGRRAQTLGRIKYTNENIYDSLRPLDTMSTLSSSKSEPPLSIAARTDYHSMNSSTIKDLDNQRTAHETSSGELMRDSDTKSTHSAEIYSQITDNTRQSLRQNRLNPNQRPKNVGVVSPSCGQSTVYLKSALKKPTQSAMQHVNEMKSSESEVALNGNLNRLAEVEYAVVDKSKKNKFTSLPALNGYNGTPGVATDTEDKDHPPVPPKKLLHK